MGKLKQTQKQRPYIIAPDDMAATIAALTDVTTLAGARLFTEARRV